MKTFYASPERAEKDVLHQLANDAGEDPILTGLLELSEGLLIILDEHRQVLCVNRALLNAFGLQDVDAVIGLRPGEMVHCTHAWDNEAGCGTGRTCASCGAAIAIVTAQTTNKPAQQRCVVTVEHNGATADLCLLVRSKPIEFHGHQLILLFLHDISTEEKREALSRVFFHDINNIVSVLTGVCQYIEMADTSEYPDLVRILSQQADRIHAEIAYQKAIMRRDDEPIVLHAAQVDLKKLLHDLVESVGKHLSAQEKTIELHIPFDPPSLHTDALLVERVLRNMLLNALEATERGGIVRLSCANLKDSVCLSVWNASYIPPELQARIFQVHFSTKSSHGRGFGTHSMKLLGEQTLGGRVFYRTYPEKGTTFCLELPLEHSSTK